MIRVKLILGVALLVGVSLLIGTAARCNEGSFAADKMVLSYYNAINNGDTAKAQSYISPGNQSMLRCTEDLVGAMAGKIHSVEVLDTIRWSEGAWGGPPQILVYVEITCDSDVPARVQGCGTCGNQEVLLVEFDSGWKIEYIS